MAQSYTRQDVERAVKEADARRRMNPRRAAALLAGRRPYAETDAVTRVASDVTVTDVVAKSQVPADEETTDRMLGERCVVGREVAYAGVPGRHFGLLIDDAERRRAVAVEQLPGGLRDPARLAAASPDAWLGTHLRHLNLFRVLKAHECEGGTLIASKYQLGESLGRLRADGNRLPIPVSVAILAGVLDALHAAHGAADSTAGPLEIVHGGLCPERILVGVDGVARVLGFGWARSVGARDQAPSGSIGYAAPEQVFDQRVDVQSDIFSAGVLLWECLTGVRLIEGESAVDGMLKFLASGARAPSRANAAVPKVLDAVVLRALEHAPERRFATAAEFASALLACLQPATAPEIGHYVQGVAWTALERRRSILANLESGRLALASSPVSRPRSAVVLAVKPVELEQEEPTHLRVEPPVFELAEITPERDATPPAIAAPPVASHWAAREPDESTAVEGLNKHRQPTPVSMTELSDAVSDNETTSAEAALQMEWIQRPPTSFRQITPADAKPLTRTVAPQRVQRQRAWMIAIGLCLVFVSAFAVGTGLREYRVPLEFETSHATAAVQAPVAELPLVPAPPLRAAAPAAATSTRSAAVAPKVDAVPVMRLEDLPVAGPDEDNAGAKTRDKARAKRDKRRARP